ncbi:MAG: MarR family winged helix-turn-helix transcriptional regulator [Sulfitobacter sp.]|nr:MarR family winged helix-turn-helix transcriptional regulator [Sulfitobacter sp.]
MSSPEPAQEADAFGGLPLHQYLTFRIARVQAKLNTQGSKMLHEAAGITISQWRVIALVGRVGRTRLSDLAREAALDKGLISRNVKMLQSLGHLQIEPDDIDHRVQHLSLTPQGKEVFQKVLPVTQRRQEWLRAELSEEEIRVFRKVLDQLEIACERVDFVDV